jgi:NAD(P)H-dependent flavin oxidoreductase YrpB (nitropropane dioxygenase family)
MNQYPIFAMAMNKVSDVNLAVAVHNAGGVGSLSVFNYVIASIIISPDLFKADIEKFIKITNSNNLLVSMGANEIFNDKLFNVLLETKVKFVECIRYQENEVPDWRYKNTVLLKKAQLLKDVGTLVFTKELDFDPVVESFDGVILKGPDGAGRVSSSGQSLEQLFDMYKAEYPDLKIVVSGGIGTADQVKHYIDRGAYGVGVGTMLAVAEESKISHQAKMKIVEASVSDLKYLSNGAQQRAIIFKELEKDNYNNSCGLVAGITDSSSGHIFSGTGVQYINSIRPARDIIEDLVKKLS